MELKMENGRYVPAQQGRLEQVEGVEELRQRILMKLTARRGGFSAMPEYGSRLYLLGRVRPSERESVAAQYVTEALSDEPGLRLKALHLREEPDGAVLDMQFSAGDETLSVQTAV